MYIYNYYYRPKNKAYSNLDIANIVDYLLDRIPEESTEIFRIYDMRTNNVNKVAYYINLAERKKSAQISFPENCKIVNINIQKEVL